MKGQSLFEIVIAIAISALVITGVVSVTTNSIRNSTFSKNNSLATSYAQQSIEWLRGQRDNDIDNFIAKTTSSTTWCLDNLPATLDTVQSGACLPTDTISGTSFIRQAAFTITNPSGKKLIEVNVTVTWSDAQGTHNVASITKFTDWRQR